MTNSNPKPNLAELFQRSRFNKFNTALQVATGQFPCSCNRLSGTSSDLDDCSICGGTGWETHSHRLRVFALRFLQMYEVEKKVADQLSKLAEGS